MKLNFSLGYKTRWGEHLCVEIQYKGRDGSVRRSDLPMVTTDGESWNLETVAQESRLHPIESFEYRYKVVGNDGDVLRTEWDLVPRKFCFDPSKDFVMQDIWHDIPLQNHLYTKAYRVTLQENPTECQSAAPLQLPLFRRTLFFRVSAPQLMPGQSLAVCGSHPALGHWNASRYTCMLYAGQQEWVLTINVAAMLDTPLEYKYVVVDNNTHSLIEWEEGDNRTIAYKSVRDSQVLVLDGGVLRVRERLWHAAGVAVPVFSLRSNHSYGCGDFGDLRRLVDWAVATGMKIIQVLPVNDTTLLRGWMDSCPYNAISVYALHPHYVDLEAAGKLSDPARMTTYHRRRQELNTLPYSDYEAVDRVKNEYLHELYQEKKVSVANQKAYHAFIAANNEWLLPYAAFCSLRDKYKTADFRQWEDFAVYNRAVIEHYCRTEARASVGFTLFVQFILHTQLKAASDYAHAKGVALMGDLSVCVGRYSVETWSRPDYFVKDAFAGTPPDSHARNGHNWYAPPYDWTAIETDGCRWWHQRMAWMEQYFDAFRIDHVLGYFRLWQIPRTAVHGSLGQFSPALPMTVEEIEAFGLVFHKELFTKPFINDKVVAQLFGVHAQYVRDNFLVSQAYNMYALKPEFDTQLKIKRKFEGRRDENSLWIRDGLYRLAADVLFIEDLNRHGMYHPRIEGYKEPIYEAMEVEDKEAFMRLYNHYFYQRHNLYWGGVAMKRLSIMLQGCNMLPTAEDLGMLPDCVEPVLDALRILTLEMQSMPKHNSGYEFAHLGANPYRSVATFSTHDTAPMRLWWEENHGLAQKYYTTMMQKEGRAPDHLSTLLAEEIIARHLYCPSMLCVMPIQDWMSMDTELRAVDLRMERINAPGDCFNRWQYRMNVTIETLMEDDRYNRKIKTMITRSRGGKR